MVYETFVDTESQFLIQFPYCVICESRLIPAFISSVWYRSIRSVPAQCIDSTQFRAGYGALSVEQFVILKSFFTNNGAFVLNKSRRAKVCPTLLIHWFVYCFSKRSSSRRTNCRKFFACNDPQPCMGVEW